MALSEWPIFDIAAADEQPDYNRDMNELFGHGDDAAGGPEPDNERDIVKQGFVQSSVDAIDADGSFGGNASGMNFANGKGEERVCLASK